MSTALTEKQRIERETFDRLVKDKTRNKPLIVSHAQPSFADYNGDLFFGAVQKMNFKGKRVLEIGCGSGEIATWLAQNGAQHVTGVDISNESIRIAKSRAAANTVTEQVEFILCPGESIPKPSGSFDIIFINVALHHLDLPLALNECKRLLVQDGLFIAIEPLVRSAFMQSLRESWIFQVLYPVRRESSTEKILSVTDVVLIEKTFGNLELDPYRVLSPFIYKIKPLFNLLSQILFVRSSDAEIKRRRCNMLLQRLDNRLIRAFPLLGIASRYSILFAHKN